MLPAGTFVDRYRVLGPLGRGTTAVVYRAGPVDDPDAQVALKVALPGTADDPEARARFLRGARAQATLDHPAIVGVREAGEDPAHGPWVAMELAGPATLATLELPAARALEVLADVAAGLDAAHAAGIVHRDVKPANVLVEPDRALLADFGLARDGDGLTRSGAVIGTLPYLAPELIRGAEPSAAADRYALAAIAYELLVGEVPFPRATDAAILYAHVGDAVPPASRRRPELPRAVDAVLARGLAKRPDARYPDAAGFSAALRDALGATTLPAPPPRSDPGAETVDPRPRPRFTTPRVPWPRAALAPRRRRAGGGPAGGEPRPHAALAPRRRRTGGPAAGEPRPRAPRQRRADAATLASSPVRAASLRRAALIPALAALAAAAFLAAAPFSDDGDAAPPRRRRRPGTSCSAARSKAGPSPAATAATGRRAVARRRARCCRPTCRGAAWSSPATAPSGPGPCAARGANWCCRSCVGATHRSSRSSAHSPS